MHALSIQPFDLLPVIELCIKYDGKLLNWNMVKRLKEVEERILEFEVWKTEEPLYRKLLAEKKQHDSPMDFLSSPRKALNFVTAKPSYFRGDSVDQSSFHPNSLENNVPTGPLELFFRKLYRLVHSRLYDLCAELGVDEKVIQKVWNVLVEAILREHEFRLLFRRHIDQTIMCSIYAVSRSLDLELTFRDIVTKYRKQPQCTQEVM